MRVRVPPVAPARLDVMHTERVEQLVWNALFDLDRRNALVTPEESLSSNDEGMTGGVLLQANGSAQHFLDGALAALEEIDRDGEATEDLRAFLGELVTRGSLLITLEH